MQITICDTGVMKERKSKKTKLKNIHIHFNLPTHMTMLLCSQKGVPALHLQIHILMQIAMGTHLYHAIHISIPLYYYCTFQKLTEFRISAAFFYI